MMASGCVRSITRTREPQAVMGIELGACGQWNYCPQMAMTRFWSLIIEPSWRWRSTLWGAGRGKFRSKMVDEHCFGQINA